VSYHGGRLAPWFDNGPTKKALMAMAVRGGGAVTSKTRELTPVGNTGHLKESWKQRPVVILVDELGRVVYESGTETHVDYAPYVEFGTGLWGPKHAKYLIEPKTPGGWLHWIGPAGEDVFAKRVWHPGSPGQHMVAIAVAAVEATLDLLLAEILELWSIQVEKQNHTGLMTW